jgi:Winged helix-turn-helix DNA-binding
MELFRQWIEDGLTSAEEIAREVGVSKGTVSKMAKKAIEEGWLKKNGRVYALVENFASSFPSMGRKRDMETKHHFVAPFVSLASARPITSDGPGGHPALP